MGYQYMDIKDPFVRFHRIACTAHRPEMHSPRHMTLAY